MSSGFELSPSTGALIGAPLELHGTARFPERFALTQDLEGKTTGPFAITRIELGHAQATGGVKTQPVKVVVVPFDVGAQTLPSLPWKLADAQGSSEALSSPPVRLDVAGPPQDSGEMRDIKAPLSAPLWPFLLWGTIAAAAAAFGIREIRRRTRRAGKPGTPEVEQDPRPAHARALQELDALAGEELPPKEFYIRLTEILRGYFERRFGIPALVLTTADFVRQMREAEIERAVVVSAREVLERADLAKFAKFAPLKPEMDRDVRSARQIVEATVPTPSSTPSVSG